MLTGLIIVIGLAFVCLLIYGLLSGPRRESGSIILAPSEGQVRVRTRFHPRIVKLYFKYRRPEPPSCSPTVDELTDIKIRHQGFEFKYRIESGVRTVRWVAKK